MHKKIEVSQNFIQASKFEAEFEYLHNSRIDPSLIKFCTSIDKELC